MWPASTLEAMVGRMKMDTVIVSIENHMGIWLVEKSQFFLKKLASQNHLGKVNQ